MFHFSFIFLLLLLMFLFSANGRLLEQNNTNKVFYIISVLFLGGLSAVKGPMVGNDTHEYIRIYELGEDALFAATRYEIGYLIYNILLNKLSSEPQFLFVVSSIFMFYSYGRFMWKHSAMPWLSVIIFFLFSLYAFSMSGLRQSIAIAILFFSFDYILDKKYYKFLVLVLIAASFHSSAVVFILVPFLTMIKLSKKSISAFLIFIILGFFFFANILSFGLHFFPMYGNYQDGLYFEGETRLASIIHLVLSVIFFIIGFYSYNAYVKTTFDKRKKQAYSLMLFFQLCTIFFYVMSLKVNIIDRFALYFSVYEIVLLPTALICQKRKLRGLLAYGLIAVLFIYSSIVLVYRPNWNSVYPYHFFWE